MMTHFMEPTCIRHWALRALACNHLVSTELRTRLELEAQYHVGAVAHDCLRFREAYRTLFPQPLGKRVVHEPSSLMGGHFSRELSSILVAEAFEHEIFELRYGQ